MNRERVRFELRYREEDFNEIFFGNSLLRLYFNSDRSRTIIVTLLTITSLIMIFKFWGHSYSIVGIMFILLILSTVYLFRVFNDLYEFYKWKTEVNQYIKKGNRYKNSTVTLDKNHFRFEALSGKDKTILTYGEIASVEKYHNRIVLNERTNNSFFFPKAAFVTDLKFEKFCNLLEERIVNSTT